MVNPINKIIKQMSRHSNIQSQDPQAEASHRNQAAACPAAHSQASAGAVGAGGKEWVATYLEGQFYLTDPDSMSKLKDIQAEIERERGRLARLEQDTLSHNNSFLSFQEEHDTHSSRSFCTEFNQSRHFSRQQAVKHDLEKEEDNYRQKLRATERERAEFRKNVKQQESREELKEQPPSPSRKQSNKEKIEEAVPLLPPSPPVGEKQLSKKASQEQQKEKSYHKSRIEESIKESGEMKQELVQPSQSAKASVKPKQQSFEPVASVKEKTEKTINIVVIQPDNTIKPSEEEPAVQTSAKGSISPQKSAKASAKASYIEPSVRVVAASAKGETISVKEEPLPSEKSVKAGSPSVKASQKPPRSETPVKIEGHDDKSAKLMVEDGNKSVKAASMRAEEALLHSPPRSHQSNQLHQFLQLEEPKHSEKKSAKPSEKAASHYSKPVSHKAESIRPSQKPSAVQDSGKQGEILSERPPKGSERAPSSHLSKEISQKAASVTPVEQEAAKSVRSPSVRASSKHSKAKELQKSIRLSEQLNGSGPVNSALQQESAVKASVKEEPALSAKMESADAVEKVSQKSVAASNRSIQEEEARSRKSSKQIEEDAKSKRPQNPVDEAKSKISAVKSVRSEIKSQIKSHKQVSNPPEIAEASQKSHKIEENGAVSRKSSKSGPNDQGSEVGSKKSSVREEASKKSSVGKEDAASQRSAKGASNSSRKEEGASSKQSRLGPEPASPLSHKSKQEEARSVPSERRSFSKKSAGQVVEASQTGKAPEERAESSILGSQVSESPSPQIQQTNSEVQPSGKESSFLAESARESSRVAVLVNQELRPEVEERAPEYDMRKRKAEENQSEKKSRSFVIHSRNGSVKDKLSNSQLSSPSRRSKDLSSLAHSATKGEILKLHEQIALLQDKLQRVEERQQQMEKMDGTLSKIHLQEEASGKKEQLAAEEEEKAIQKVETKEVEAGEEIAPALRAVEPGEVQVRPQARLQIESSILQVNTLEEVRKEREREHDSSEKARLREEIGRLKRIIRDMQIEKIRSIDPEPEDASPRASPHASRIDKDSLSSLEGTQPRRFGSTSKRLLEDAGRIVHNSSGFTAETPRRKSISKLRLPEEDGSEVGELPPESGKRVKGKLYVEARRGELAARIGEKERDFHSFIESSRVIAEESGRPEPEPAPAANPLRSFSKVAVAQDVDYSRLVQEMRKANPEEEEVLPEVHLRDVQMPALPEGPQAGMSQEELLGLARATYLAFGVEVEAEGRQLCVKKYKNCVVFSLDGQHHQCVLWHFSGKFYMGSWRAGEPGEGEKDGEGLELVPGKHLYKGQFLAGKRHGSGILKQANGNIYDGQWADGVKSGRGVYLDAATRVLYSGEWREGRKEGQGFLKLSEKEYYFGTFVRSIKEGFGVEVFVNGDKYRGEYRAGKFHGRGKYLWANGSCYEGQFHEGVRHGQGSWRSARTSPDIYIGAYERDKKTGYGRYVWANGCMYEGGFANDLKHGRGRLTYQDGKEIKGTWEDGNLVATEQEKRPEHEDQPLRRSVKVSSFLPASAKRI